MPLELMTGSFSFTDLLHICKCFSSVGASCARDLMRKLNIRE